MELPMFQFEEKNGKDKFQLIMNAREFKPEELEVKVVDQSVLIFGKHEEKTDDRFIQLEFSHRFVLPEGTDPETVMSSWSTDGILTIEAPKKAVETSSSKERNVPISTDDKAKNCYIM